MDLSQFGASGAVVVVVILFLKFMKEEGVKRDSSYERVAIALDKITKSTDKNTVATKSADQYLRQRNGRDMEFHKEVMGSLQAIPNQIRATALVTAKELARKPDLQNIKEQHVDKQIINK